MRKTPVPPCPAGVAPSPLTCGWKNRAATLEATKYAVKPWKFGTLARSMYPGILELCHSIGNVIGVFPKHAEVVRIVRVLPQVLAVNHQDICQTLAGIRREIHCESPGVNGAVMQG